MLIIPILGMIYFSQQEVRNAMTSKAESSSIASLANFSVKASSMVHELQKERGSSAGYIGSKGRKFKKNLAEQHSQTDLKITDLKIYLDHFDRKHFGKHFESTLNKALSDLNAISEKRTNISKLNLGLKQALKYYTNLNTQFLSLAGEMSKLSSSSEISLLASSYSSFLQSKERAGIERAVLANTFSADSFSTGMFNKFMSLVTTQIIYIDVFKSLAPQSQIDFYQKTLQGEAITETEKMRTIAINNADTGQFNIDSNYWFKKQTEKINLLKEVEDQLSKDIITKAGLMENAAQNTLQTLVIFSVIIVLITITLAIFFIRIILKQLGCDPKYLLEVVEAIAQGNLNMQLGDTGNNATGVFASAQVMQTNLRESIEKDRLLAAETGRIKQGLDNVNSNVMLADNDLNIIYMNNSVKDMFKNAEADIRQQIPSFDSSQLIGTCIDKFHSNPAHQRGILSNLETTFRSSLVIGTRHLDIVANPVINENHERQGTIVEWVDRTSEVIVEKEIENIVNNVKAGELSSRLQLSDKKGFIKTLSTDINELSDVIENVFSNINNTMQSLATGELSNKITATDYQGVYLECKNHINSSIDNLAKTVTQINESAGGIKTSSEEIASGNNNLSQRAEQQAANLEETASSMEELTSTVINNTENAKQANQVASKAKVLAEQGGDIVKSAIHAMEEINQSSNKISEMIGVIDEIAFQTNLLALNASVEAARAGDHGRGFSVVATEVRNLAQRSAKAAKESKSLIQASVKNVTSGSEFVNKTGNSLAQIVNSVKDVNDIVAEITNASIEQSQGIEQVNQAVSQMDEITQQNAALAEQASAASISMSEEAKNMSKLLSFFRV